MQEQYTAQKVGRGTAGLHFSQSRKEADAYARKLLGEVLTKYETQLKKLPTLNYTHPHQNQDSPILRTHDAVWKFRKEDNLGWNTVVLSERAVDGSRYSRNEAKDPTSKDWSEMKNLKYLECVTTIKELCEQEFGK